MAMPEKEHFSFEEVGLRWGVSMSDVEYTVCHRDLEVQTWLPESIIKLYRLMETKDGRVVPVRDGISNFHGYAIVESDEVRKIIYADVPVPVRKFKCPYGGNLFSIYDAQKCPLLTVKKLLISRSERDRFESKYNIDCHSAQNTKAVTSRRAPSFAGRPSVMRRIITHFKERCEQQMVLPSLQKESDYLAVWAAQHITDSQAPQSKAIMNSIRADYRRHTQIISGDFRQMQKNTAKSIA